MKIYYSGASGRKVGLILGMSKANVYNWIKKTAKNEYPKSLGQTFNGCYELDELYWFVERKAKIAVQITPLTQNVTHTPKKP